MVVYNLMCLGTRASRFLAADSSAAVSIDPVPAFQRGHPHPAPGERRAHRSCLIHTHRGELYKT